MEKHLLYGNEAIARGAYEAGVRVCSAYPGTPSTEILEMASAKAARSCVGPPRYPMSSGALFSLPISASARSWLTGASDFRQ